MSSIARRPHDLGAILQRQRRLLRLTQTDVSDLIGTGQKTISKLENGNPATRIDTLFSLLAALDLELVIQPRGKGWPIDPEDIF
jgi:HTH-type transcriptional regulator/antitoxin HipB